MSQPFAGLTTAPLFTSSAGVRDAARLVQAVTKRGDLAGDFGAHSRRAGFVTSAARKKVPEADIQRVTRHRSVATLRGYVRRATLFEDPSLVTTRDLK